MSISIEELDATVRSFYEGRGETVGGLARGLLDLEYPNTYCSKSKHKQRSTRSVENIFIYFRSRYMRMLNERLVQREPGLLAHRGQNPVRRYLSSDKV